MKKIINFINENRIILIFLTFFLLVLLEHQFIWLYHDDYGYASLSYIDIGNVGMNYGLEKIFEFLYVHYMTWGGRILCFFVECVLLRLGLPVFRFVQSMVIVLIFYTIYKILLSKTKLKDYQLALLTVSMYGFLDIMLLRNSVFWASASISYLFPLLPFVLLVYTTLQKKKGYIWLSAIFAFLAAFSQEQIAAMTIIYVILFIIDEWFIKKKKDKKQLYILFLSVIGFAILMLAPGNFVRLDTSSQFANQSIFEKLLTTIPALISELFATYNGMFLNLFFITILIITLKNLKTKNWFIKLCSFSNIIIVLLSIFIDNANYFNYFSNMTTNRIYLTIIYAIYILQLIGIIISVCYYFWKKDHMFIQLFIASIGSLAVMLVAPYYPPRSSLPFIIISFILIIYIIGNFLKEYVKSSNCLNYIISSLVLISFINFTTIVRGYYINNAANKYNNDQLIIASDKIKNGEIIEQINLKKLPNITYGGDMPYMEDSDYILKWIKNYYSIPEEVEIIYEG